MHNSIANSINDRCVDAASALCAALPFLIAFSQTPSTTLFNQLAAFAACGATLVLLRCRRSPPSISLNAGVLAVAILLVMGVYSKLVGDLHAVLNWSYVAMTGAGLAVLFAAQQIDSSERERCWANLSWAMLAAGLASVVVAVVQVFAPGLADGDWIARSGLPGRAIGNMRQPNHLASLLMWSCIATVYLAESGLLGRRGRLAMAALPSALLGLVFGVVLSASRTGMLAVLLLALWALLDRSLSARSRWSLLATPLMLALSWAFLSWWAHSHAQVFGAESRLAEGAGSPSRLAILSNALDLLQRYPWSGVGVGEFNLAWTMTPFPDRPVAFFDHTHDLPMQLLVELGLPLGLLVLALLGTALWKAWRYAYAASGSEARIARSALMMVLMIGLHSLLEYPLWYAYFLLPTAFALGICSPRETLRLAADVRPARWPRVAGAMLLLGSAYAAWDYNKVVVIYAPPAGAASLEERIAIGQRSLFFSTQADYAAATSFSPGPEALAAAKRTAHNLIDARLMMAWAKSLHATGDTDRARYVAARLREFRNAAAKEWFEECETLAPGAPRPFQCDPPQREYSYREMR
ncbi:Wzy polymerase domain-containing protein [Paucibacter sp. APW11]|uniref:Wzy polymerase domain-containing protein n=1 Tax=Roseateles aquae TaxID=3077235 RepID=A0ABU3PEN4_9BURK|nr:Wzy polymerase domain-containing protein [Paucibacter sp. APW11]MDT9001001.1 Wzy polymerase domain-containing protein [Paucibacter sp. APW11]